MRIEHRQALAALARLRAEILEHEAEVEMMAEQIRSHESEMSAHDHAMHEHEEHGHGEKHNDLKSTHTDVMKNHVELSKKIDAESEHHGELIAGILKFYKSHAEKFHGKSGEKHDGHKH